MEDTILAPGVLEPVDLLNRPNSSTKPNILLEAIRLFQKKDNDSVQAAMKIVREAIRDPSDDADDSKWNRVSFFNPIFKAKKKSETTKKTKQ